MEMRLPDWWTTHEAQSLLMCVQNRQNGRQYLLDMSPDKVPTKAGDFGNHMGLELAHVSTLGLLGCEAAVDVYPGLMLRRYKLLLKLPCCCALSHAANPSQHIQSLRSSGCALLFCPFAAPISCCVNTGCVHVCVLFWHVQLFMLYVPAKHARS